MTRLVALFVVIAAPVFAQTPPIDDCPAGHELHHSLTALDRQSMLAAYTASFVGLFHRQPSMQPGSGSDDGNYWTGISDHYGLYGDDVCRAGWNLYRERQLGGIPTGPRDGDLPAQFLPNAPMPAPMPTPVPTPQPVPQPLPSPPICPSPDLSAIVSQISNVGAQVIACNQGIANVGQNVTDGRKENQQFYADARNAWNSFFEPIVKYVLPAVGTFIAGWKVAK